VLRRVRRNAVRRGEPVEVARTRAVEPQLDRGVEQRGEEARLEVHLQREHEVEPAAQPAPHVAIGGQAARLVELDDLVHVRVPAHQRGRARLQDPRDVCV
jgi:hypothetical protein